MIPLKKPEELDAMREAGHAAARVLDEMVRHTAPGVTTGELDDLARDTIRRLGATSAFLGYRGFPGHTCISVNEEVVHGIPGSRIIQSGDLVSIDVGVFYRGFVGDNARSVLVGAVDPRVGELVRVARESLDAGISKAVPGGRLGDISNAIETVIRRHGFSVVKDYVGHGVGRALHEEPQIPNFGPAGKGPVLRAGMTLAIEPMLNLGAAQVVTLADKWTVVTRDRKPSAHVEHTIAITENGPEVLTPWPSNPS
ncbi:MAG: type I methionyl aminopeptidase [Kiritimatiellia bacterium]